MKITDLFHALTRGTAKAKERGTTTGPEKPRQTDSANADASGDSRERPAFDFKQLPDVDDATVEAFFSALNNPDIVHHLQATPLLFLKMQVRPDLAYQCQGSFPVQ